MSDISHGGAEAANDLTDVNGQGDGPQAGPASGADRTPSAGESTKYRWAQFAARIVFGALVGLFIASQGAAMPVAVAIGGVAAFLMILFQSPMRKQRSTDAGFLHDDIDPIAEAMVYHQYGRDAQAEEILNDAIARQPDRQDLRDALAEVRGEKTSESATQAIADNHSASSNRSQASTEVDQLAEAIVLKWGLLGGDHDDAVRDVAQALDNERQGVRERILELRGEVVEVGRAADCGGDLSLTLRRTDDGATFKVTGLTVPEVQALAYQFGCQVSVVVVRA